VLLIKFSRRYIDGVYKQTILAAKSWGMLASYGLGVAFIDAVKARKMLEEATDAELKTLEYIFLNLVEAQANLMDTVE